MKDEHQRRQMDEALRRLQARIESPRVLAPTADDRVSIESAIERARAQLLGPSEPVLTVALAGGTGAGKSTLINALAGRTIAEASEIRPTTRHLQVYHHRDDTLGTLTDDLAGEASFVAHDRPELRLKMLVDSPDLDSFVIRNRATTKALLKRAGLVLYVFSPERYMEERTWSVLRQETEFSACAAVLNKVDRLGSPDEREQIVADLRARFASLGQGTIRIFGISAQAHVPGAAGTLPGPPPEGDEMAALRAFIERELEASEIARLLRSQRGLVVAHLRAEVDRVAPAETIARLDEVVAAASRRGEAAAARLAAALADPLAAVETELAPLVTLRRHERFWGPFRTWLAVADFLGFGMTSLARRLLGRRPDEPTGAIERILARGGSSAVADLLRGESYGLQDLLYARGLPIDRWRALSTATEPARVVAEVASEIETHFDLKAAQDDPWQHGVVWAASTLGGLVPSAFVVIGLVVMVRDLVTGHDAGPALLGHLAAIVVLIFLVLQGIVSVLLPGGTQWLGTGVGARAVHAVLTRTLDGWIGAYRTELAADVADLREPLSVLHLALSGPEETLALGSAPAPPPAIELTRPIATTAP